MTKDGTTIRIVRLTSIIIVTVFALGVTEAMVKNAGAMSGPPRTIRAEPLNDVLIGHGRIAVPLGTICLIRFDSSYCAVRFSNAHAGATDAEDYASYESWYQGDTTGLFSKSNVVFRKGDLWWKAPLGIGRIWLLKRDRDEISCGPILLKWWPYSSIAMIPKKAEGVSGPLRFAPTPWTSISEVNVHDARIKWYDPGMRGENTPDIRIPIDQLWK